MCPRRWTAAPAPSASIKILVPMFGLEVHCELVGLHLSRGSRGDSIPLSVPASRGHLHLLACGQKLSIFKSLSLSLFLFSHLCCIVMPFLLTFTFLPPSFQDSCDYIGPTHIIISSIISSSQDPSHLQSSFCHARCHLHRFWI